MCGLMSTQEETLPQLGAAGEFVFLLNKAGWEKVIKIVVSMAVVWAEQREM